MLDFYNTKGGREFVDYTIPRLINSIDALTAELKRSNDLKSNVDVAPTSAPKSLNDIYGKDRGNV